MKKLIIAIMSVLMVLSIAGLTACKNNNSDNNDGHELWTIQKVYAQAQDLGFEGTLEELIALFKGDKGETGAPGENGINGQDGIGIKDISVNSEGKLIIVLSNNSTIDCGVVKGQDGANGINGKDGVSITSMSINSNGELVIALSNGQTTNCGIVKGSDGVGIASIEINTAGELVLTMTDMSTKNLGIIKGQDGANGQDGKDGIDGINGKDGISITSVTINEKGELIVSLSQGEPINCGVVVGSNGKDGTHGQDGVNGKDGKDGVSITSMEVNDEGELVITLSNDEKVSCGIVKGADGKNGSIVTIGVNGNWFIDGVDTNIPAKGKDGQDGTNGKDGINGQNGYTPYIQDGYWYINGENTGVKATGSDGKDGINGTNGKDGVNGQDGKSAYQIWLDLGNTGTEEDFINWLKGSNGIDGADGKDGENGKDGINGQDGHTPYIQDGYWYINGTNTGVKATGNNGTNGADGKTPYIQDGYWYIDGENTGVKAVGSDGKDGINGTNGKDGENGQNGADGVGVKNAYVDENLHLWIELTNGTKIDAGYVGVEVSAPVVEKYTVTFYDYDGTTELKVEEVVKGESATAPENPTRWGYTFTGWDKTFDNVTENISITAIYTEITEPTFIVTSAIVNAGENAVITLTVKNNPGIMNAMLNLRFNDVELTLTTAENGPALSNSTLTKPKYLVSGCNFIYDGLDVSNTDDGVILTLTFETSLNAMSGTEYSIEFSYVQGDIVDGNLYELTLNTINGKITIK